MDHFDQDHVFLAIATNIPQRVKTDFVVQGHILHVDPQIECIMCRLFLSFSNISIFFFDKTAFVTYYPTSKLAPYQCICPGALS